MKKLSLFAFLALTSCGLFTPGATSPCPGLWCIYVEEVPGARLCYETEAKMLDAKKAYEAKGAKVTVAK